MTSKEHDDFYFSLKGFKVKIIEKQHISRQAISKLAERKILRLPSSAFKCKEKLKAFFFSLFFERHSIKHTKQEFEKRECFLLKKKLLLRDDIYFLTWKNFNFNFLTLESFYVAYYVVGYIQNG